jgi:GNAT superfamily N-acetyltransferase
MTVKLRRSYDWELIGRLHDKCFGEGVQPDWKDGSVRAAWVATDDAGVPVGFCTARLLDGPDKGCVFLERAGVLRTAQGVGLQRRMIRVRTQWARDKVRAKVLLTYASPSNFPSIVNLTRAGLRLYTPEKKWGVEGAFYFRKDLA